jgi:hypothetical protein
MAARHISVDIPLPLTVWDLGQQRIPPCLQWPSSAVNSTWLQQHFPFPVMGRLMTRLLRA